LLVWYLLKQVVVRWDSAISDLAAKKFFRGFYLNLFRGETVLKSFKAGESSVESDPDPDVRCEAGKFLLLPEGDHHDVPAFNLENVDVEKDETWVDLTSPKHPISNLPPLPEPFVGRANMIQFVFSTVLKNRLVTLTGVRGSGKSSIVRAVGNYVIGRIKLDWLFYVSFDMIFRSSRQYRSLGEYCSQSIGPDFPSCSTDEDFVRACRTKRCLFIFHGVQTLQEKRSYLDPQLFLNQLFTCRDVRVLLTSTRSVRKIKDVAQKVRQLSFSFTHRGFESHRGHFLFSSGRNMEKNSQNRFWRLGLRQKLQIKHPLSMSRRPKC
jgi:hypothetical protein